MTFLPKSVNNQRGAAPLVLILAVIGLLAFLIISNTFNFKNSIFNTLFPKPASHAAAGLIFVDNNHNPISSTTSPTVTVELDAPWPVADANFVQTANAQAVNTISIASQVGYWNFDEGSAATAKNGGSDTSLTGTIKAGTWVVGKFGKAINLGGSGYVSIPSDSQTNQPKNQDFSFSLWLKTTGTNDAFPLSKGAGSTGDTGYALILSGGYPILALSRSQESSRFTLQGTKAIADNNWHLVTGTFDRSRSKVATLYVDGVKQASATIPNRYIANPLSNSYPLYLGCYSPDATACFTGGIDDVRLYRRVLTASEVATLANSTVTPSCVYPVCPPLPTGCQFVTPPTCGGTCPSVVCNPTPTPATQQYNIFGNTVPGNANQLLAGGYELGLKFQTNTTGYVTGVRFYKGSSNTGTHTGSLWTTTGTLLATVTFSNETASGWQQANFSTPIPIQTNTTYIVSYHENSGYFGYDDAYLTSPKTSGPLTALADGTDGPNGVFINSSTTTFPNDSYNASNYWVDIIFQTNNPASSTPVPTSTPTMTVTKADLAEDINFTQNLKTVQPISSIPIFTDYTFSNSTIGLKTLYARFTASDGTVQTYSSTINLTSPNSTPTPTPTPTAIPTIAPVSSVCPAGSTIITGGTLSSAVANVPSGGTLCLNGGSYSVSSISINKPVTIVGVNNPQISQTSQGTVFSISSGNVTIQGLNIKGAANGNDQNSCSFGSIAFQASTVKNVTIKANNLDFFTCGGEFDGTDTFNVSSNTLSRIGYAGFTTDPGYNGTFDSNIINDVGVGYAFGTNAYGITATGSGAGNESKNITISNNTVKQATTWECYDTHNGQNISFTNNTCYKPGTVGINVANDYSGAMSPHNISITGNVIDTQAANNRDGSIVLYGISSDEPTGNISTNKLYGFTSSGSITVGPGSTPGVIVNNNICDTSGAACTFTLP